MSLVDDIQQLDDTAKTSRPWLFVVAILVAAAAFVFVAINSFDQKVYYFTVEEAAAEGGALSGTYFRLKGNVEIGSHFIREGSLDEHRFVLVEGGESLPVTFRGPLPDTFQDEAEVVAVGRMSADGVFVAEEVSAKCPSRYEAEAPTASE